MPKVLITSNAVGDDITTRVTTRPRPNAWACHWIILDEGPAEQQIGMLYCGWPDASHSAPGFFFSIEEKTDAEVDAYLAAGRDHKTATPKIM